MAGDGPPFYVPSAADRSGALVHVLPDFYARRSSSRGYRVRAFLVPAHPTARPRIPPQSGQRCEAKLASSALVAVAWSNISFPILQRMRHETLVGPRLGIVQGLARFPPVRRFRHGSALGLE